MNERINCVRKKLFPSLPPPHLSQKSNMETNEHLRPTSGAAATLLPAFSWIRFPLLLFVECVYPNCDNTKESSRIFIAIGRAAERLDEYVTHEEQ